MCDNICRDKPCNEVDTPYDSCRRCPTIGYKCNINRMNHNIETNTCNEKSVCKTKLCRDISDLETVIDECGKCDNSEYKCNSNTPDYNDIVNNHVKKLNNLEIIDQNIYTTKVNSNNSNNSNNTNNSNNSNNSYDNNSDNNNNNNNTTNNSNTDEKMP